MRIPFYSVVASLLLHVSIAQQRPFMKVEVFDQLSKSYKTDVCDRQLQLYDENIILREALQGLNLTVAMTNYKVPNEDAFFTLVNGKIKERDPGLFVVIMDEIARRAGFSWRNTFVAIDPLNPVTHPNKTWTDLLEWELDNFDIAADYWARSTDRMSRGISFPQGWYDGSVILVTSEGSDGNKFNLWSFLLPFDATVWVAIGGAIIFSGLSYFFLERLNSDSDEHRLDEKPVAAIFLAANTFTGHYEFEPKTHASRLFGFSWSFWALIMASAYTANMASFLVSRHVAVASVSTIDDAVRLAVPVCVQRGAIIDEILSKKSPDLILVRKESEGELFDALKKPWYGGQGGCGLVLTNMGTFQVYQSQKSSNADCSLTSDMRVILHLPAGFATAVDSGILCTSLVSYVLDLHLQEMKADGFIDQAWENHIEKISTVSCDEPSTSSSSLKSNFSLGLKDMGGIFIMHAVMMILSLTFAFAQYFYTRYRIPDRNVRPLSFSSVRGQRFSSKPLSGTLSLSSRQYPSLSAINVGRIDKDGDNLNDVEVETSTTSEQAKFDSTFGQQAHIPDVSKSQTVK